MAICATTQQSRFHTETLQTTCEDVDLKQLTLTIGDAELLSSADLRLFAGVKYGLVGANGVGKSTLLKAMGNGLVVGFPSNLRTVYVDQLETMQTAGAVLSLAHSVMAADKEVAAWWRHHRLLQASLDCADPGEMVAAIRAVKLDELREKREEAELTNELRSGERGKVAQHELLRVVARLEAAEGSFDSKPSKGELDAAPHVASLLFQEIQANLELADAFLAEERACKLLLGLGFSKAALDQPITKLSGGWQAKASLAQALFMEPDILLLDEPTNALDVEGIIFLQKYLHDLEAVTVCVISHDRAFLDAVTQETIVFRDRQLTYHAGNYSTYRQAADEDRLHKLRLQEGINKKKSQLEGNLKESLNLAHKKGDDKKIKQVAARRKKLESHMGLEKNEKGHRFQINKDMPSYSLTLRQEVIVEAVDKPPPWKIQEAAPLRSHLPLITTDSVSFAYPPASTPTASGIGSLKGSKPARKLLQNVTLCIEQDARVAFVGKNGKGKSTLIKLLLGELSPVSGTVDRLPQAKISWYQQSNVEDLILHKGSSTPLNHIRSLYPGHKEQYLRNQLGLFGIRGGTASQPMNTLSGGQAVRVQLAIISLSAPNLLVLDEVSSHLDLISIEALTACLQKYTGAVVLVSHDQHFVSEVANKVYLVDKQQVTWLEGGVIDYVKSLKKKNKGSV